MSTTSIQNTDDPTASKKCQGDGRSGSGAQLLETAALWLACQGNGSGTPVMAGLGLQRLGPSLCAGCGCRAGSRVAASRDTFFFFLKRALPDSGRRTAQALPKPDDATKHPGARHRLPRDRYFLRHRRKAGRPRSLSNRPNMAPGRRAHV